MSLSRGAHLGSYEILDLLGAGGMGEVYRARDAKLDRDVAVKVLPDVFARDPDRLARFEREARLLAALSHPNILAIHDFGVDDGVAYAVTELLHGETLRTRLQSGPMPVRRAIDLAIHIAAGLAAAHEKGIVHRDLKPENVFVTTDGRVKILDFGLARSTAPMRGSTDLTAMAQTPTIEGAVLGTVGYMSPEQVRGAAADHRSDIFSFGALLYEAISGRRAFDAPTPVEAMTAILHADPPDLGAVNANAPAPLQRLIERCLEKPPERRFQSASDLAFALQQISPSSSTATTTPEALQVAPGLTRVSRWWQMAIVGALIMVAFAAGRWLMRPVAVPERFAFHRLTFRLGNVLNARFAADGRTVVYSASWQAAPTELFTVRTDGIGSRSLDIHDATVAGISPTGELAIIQSTAHAAAAGTLARVPLGGGGARVLMNDVTLADWGPRPDDLAVVRRTANGFRRLEYPVGHALYDSQAIGSMRLSPDARQVALVTGSDLVVIASDTGAVALRHNWGANGRVGTVAWSPSGRELFLVAGADEPDLALRAVDLSGRERVLFPVAGGRLDVHDVSREGDLLVERALPRGGILFRGAGDKDERDLSWLDGSEVRQLSADGTMLLFSEALQGASALGDVFVRKTDGAPAVRLGDGRPLALSADGTLALAMTADRPRKLALLPTGAGTPRVFDPSPYVPNGGTLLKDGRIAFGSVAANGGVEFHTIDPRTGAIAPMIVAGGGEASAFVLDRGAVFGPDGSIARVLPDGHVEVLTPTGTRTVVPGRSLDDGDSLTAWLGDGNLYVSRRPSMPQEVYRIDVRTGVRTPWRTLMPADPNGLISIRNVVVTQNGDAYAYSYRRVVSSDLYVVKAAR